MTARPRSQPGPTPRSRGTLGGVGPVDHFQAVAQLKRAYRVLLTNDRGAGSPAVWCFRQEAETVICHTALSVPRSNKSTKDEPD
jgi:hypothetical protein